MSRRNGPHGCSAAARMLPVLFLMLNLLGPGGGTAGGVGHAAIIQANAADAGKIHERARQLAAAGRYQQALELLKPLADKPGTFPSLASDYIVFLFWAGKPAEATGRFERLPADMPKRPYLLRNMAKAYLDQGRVETAAGLYRRVLALTPDDAVAVQGLAQSRLAAGKADQALAVITDYERNHPSPRPLSMVKARVLIALQRYVPAFGLYRQLIRSDAAAGDAVARTRDDFIAGLPDADRQQMIEQLAAAARSGDATAAQAYILALCLSHRYQAAEDTMSRLNLADDQLPADVLYRLAWARFRLDRIRSARAAFDTILRRRPDHRPARIGVAYCRAEQGAYKDALTILENLGTRNERDTEVLFALAHVHESAGRYWEAVAAYDQILRASPGHHLARRWRLRALSDMGASGYALSQARQELPNDSDLHDSLTVDQAVARLRWKAPDKARRMLAPLAADARSRRAVFDYIAALVADDRFSAAVAAFERLDRETPPPAWLKIEVADAFSVLHQPETALVLLDEALAVQPDNIDALMGKLAVLQQLRRWEAAEQLVDVIDKKTPATLGWGRAARPNPRKAEVDMARGWLLIAQNRLKDADRYLAGLQRTMPANTDLRNARAHVHLWRGWPRQALDEFRIIKSMAPADRASEPGLISTLDTLAFKKRARTRLSTALASRPRDRYLLRTAREFERDQARVWLTRAAGQWEDDQTYDITVRSELSSPVTLYTRAFAYLLWRRTWNENPSAEEIALGDDTPSYYRRIGAGIDHIFNQTWRLRQAFSVNYNDGRDFGSLTRVTFTPDDVWRASAYYDSFSTDVAKRARAAGIDATEAGGQLIWRQSDWRQAGAGYTRSHFSDGNDRDDIFAGYEQNIWQHHDWRMRLFFDVEAAWNSLGGQTVYFNPKRAWQVSATHMTEQTLWDTDEQLFVHRFFVSVGSYQQAGFSGSPVGSLRYEQEHDFSPRHSLFWGISWGRNVYDGQAVGDVSLDLAWRWRF